jgi:hypothetical protein
MKALLRFHFRERAGDKFNAAAYTDVAIKRPTAYLIDIGASPELVARASKLLTKKQMLTSVELVLKDE